VNASAPPTRVRGCSRCYDRALPQVYGYLAARVNEPAVAEDLTGETFLAAVRAVHEHKVADLTTAWLITVARNKLVVHWRRLEREERTLGLARPARLPAWSTTASTNASTAYARARCSASSARIHRSR